MAVRSQTYLFLFMPAPIGLARGFVSVTLGYVLVQRGFSVGQVATLVSLFALAETLRFLIGPLLDVSLTPRRWYWIGLLLGVAGLLILGLGQFGQAQFPIMGALVLALAAGFQLMGGAYTALLAQLIPDEQRGAAAGWVQTGNLGGTGLGGGLGLWLASHWGGLGAAASVLAAISLLCGCASLVLRGQTVTTGGAFATRFAGVGRALVQAVRVRSGALAVIALVLPAGLGAATGLLSSVSGEWRASPDLVALVLGVLSAVLNLPGCLAAGYLCDRLPTRAVFIGSCLVFAASQVILALGPRTPEAFVILVLLGAVALGGAWTTAAALIYRELTGAAAATLGTVLGSLSNVPVAVTTYVVGQVAAQHGVSAMLLTEAALGVASMLFLMLAVWVWKPAPVSGAVQQPQAA